MAEDPSGSAEDAYTRRDYRSAADLFLAAIELASQAERPRLMLRRAAALERAGEPMAAWDVCEEVARLARQREDPMLLADAATTLGSTTHLELAHRINALCVEALSDLPRSAVGQRRRVEALLKGSTSPWVRSAGGNGPIDDHEERFLILQAEHAERTAPELVHERLGIADEIVTLGRQCGQLEYVAWGLARRLDALAQLGDRVGIDAEIPAFERIVERLQQPSWSAHLLRVRAGMAVWDGQISEARELTDRALLACPQDPQVQRLHLVWRESLARLDGRGLEEVEPAVRQAVTGAPYFARGWLALTLCSLGRMEEAREIWVGLASHVGTVPVGAPESLIARVGHAELCVALEDGAAAPATYAALAPWSHLFACGGADTPSGGPVDLVLGRLAVLAGELDVARSHLTSALSRSQSDLALTFTAGCQLAWAEHAAATGSSGALESCARSARDLASSLGLVFIERAANELLSRRRRSGGLLTAREEEVVALLAADQTNRQIAERLVLSERTVENHVSHALTKTGLATRAGLAGWYVGLGLGQGRVG